MNTHLKKDDNAMAATSRVEPLTGTACARTTKTIKSTAWTPSQGRFARRNGLTIVVPFNPAGISNRNSACSVGRYLFFVAAAISDAFKWSASGLGGLWAPDFL